MAPQPNTGTTNNGTPGQQPPGDQPPAVSTLLTMPGYNNGQPFDIKDFPTAEGLRLYPTLPPEAKQEADSIARLARDFRSVYDIKVPKGTTLTGLLGDYFHFLQTGGGLIGDDAPPEIKDLDAKIGPALRELPVFKQIMAGKDTVDGATNGASAAWDALKGTIMLIPNLVTATFGAGGELMHLVGNDISDDQARAFGAAYATATYDQGAARRALPLIAWPSFLGGQPSQVFSNFGTYISAFFEWFFHLPWINNAWAVVTDCFIPWIKSFFDKSIQVPGIEETWTKAQTQLDQRNAGADTSITGLAESRLRGTDRKAAAGQMVAARRVADVDTTVIAPLAAYGGRYVNNKDLKLHDYNTDRGTPRDTTVVDAKGNPVTVTGRAADRMAQPFSFLAPILKDPISVTSGVTVLGTLGGAQVVRGVVEGTARQFVGPKSVAGQRAATAAENLETAQGRLKAAQEARTAAEGAPERTLWQKLTGQKKAPTEAEIKALEDKVAKAQAEVAAKPMPEGKVPGVLNNRVINVVDDVTPTSKSTLGRILEWPGNKLRQLGRIIGDTGGGTVARTGTAVASAPPTIGAEASAVWRDVIGAPRSAINAFANAHTAATAAFHEGRWLDAGLSYLRPLAGPFKFAARRAPEIGAALMAWDDGTQTVNSARAGDTRNTVVGTSRVAGGVTGTLLAGGWWAGLWGGGTAAATTATTAAVATTAVETAGLGAAVLAGAEVGGEGGAAVGVVGGGVGAIPGAIVGFIGGAIVGGLGYYGGRWLLGHATATTYDAVAGKPPQTPPGDIRIADPAAAQRAARAAALQIRAHSVHHSPPPKPGDPPKPDASPGAPPPGSIPGDAIDSRAME